MFDISLLPPRVRIHEGESLLEGVFVEEFALSIAMDMPEYRAD